MSEKGLQNRFDFDWLFPLIVTETIQIGVALYSKRLNETYLDTYNRLRDNSLGYLNTCLAVVCLVVIFCLNLIVLRSVRLLLKRNRREGESLKRATVTILAIVVTYALFYLPSWVIGILFLLYYRFDIPILTSLTASQRRFIVVIFTNLKILNTVSDPIIYVMRISKIRNEYIRILLKFKWWGNRRNSKYRGTSL